MRVIYKTQKKKKNSPDVKAAWGAAQTFWSFCEDFRMVRTSKRDVATSAAKRD